MNSMFTAAMVCCITDERTPRPDEFLEVVSRVRFEAFPRDHSAEGWSRAWVTACVAVGGTQPVPAVFNLEAYVTFAVSLSTGSGPALQAEAHPSASSALRHLRELREAGADVTIMGPNGEKLDETALADLAQAEAGV